jgi:CHAT domain-containing protein/Tfp pilus assembly protein PilF
VTRRSRPRALLCTGVALGFTASLGAAEHTELLQPGLALSREISPGEAHHLRFELGAGEFLEALVEQRGVDVAITVVEPDGHVALEIDTRLDPTRTERVLWVGRSSGTHSLRLRAAPLRPGGGYRVLLDAPRPAAAGDATRVSAQRDHEQAVRLWRGLGDGQGTAQGRPEALRRLESALVAFRSERDRRGEGETLEEMAGIHALVNRQAQALSHAEQALAIARELQDRPAEVAALGRIGWATYWLGDKRRGVEQLQEVLRIARETSNAWRESICLNDLGTIHRRSGEAEKAIELQEQAVAKSRASGNRRGEAFSLNNLGTAFKDLGEYGQAIETFERALPAFRALNDGLGEARTLNNLGNVLRLQGDDARARELYLQLLAFARETDPGGDDEASALNNLASIAYGLGDYEEALAYGRRSLEIRRPLRRISGMAFSMQTVGQSLHKLGRSEEALATLRDARGIRRDLGERYEEAETLLALATVERDRGNLREALEHAQAAVSLTDALRSEVTSPDLRASFVAAEHDKYDLLVDLSMRLHDREPAAGHDAAALQASERARARILLEALVEARADIRQGVEPGLVERERALQKQLRDAAARLSGLLAQDGANQEVAAARREVEARSEEYRQCQARIRQESPRYAALMQPAAATVDEIRRDLLDEDTVLLEFYLGEERSFLWAVTRSALVSQALPARAAIEAAARKVHGLLTERQRTRTPAALREADRQLEIESMALSRLLLDAVATRLEAEWKGKRLLIVSSGALAYVPFGALPSPAAAPPRPLLAEHSIVSIPSASVLVALRREPARPAGGRRLAVVADPVFDAGDPRVRASAKAATKRGAGGTAPSAEAPTGLRRAMASQGRQGFSRLPFSRGEANAIGTLVADAALLKATDFAATRALVTDGGLAGHRIVHFATHGLLDAEHPDLSGLVLSLVDEQGAPRDGFLRMHEIYNLRLDADLVVLSACQTALGREVRGEGLVGVTRGFLYAGARSVVASLWQVDDESTAELMKRFYRVMLQEGRGPADALRTAQVELSRQSRWAAPFYWAGFVLQGEWR